MIRRFVQAFVATSVGVLVWWYIRPFKRPQYALHRYTSDAATWRAADQED